MIADSGLPGRQAPARVPKTGRPGVVLPIIEWNVDQFNCRVAVALQRERTAGTAELSCPDYLLRYDRSIAGLVGMRAGEPDGKRTGARKP